MDKNKSVESYLYSRDKRRIVELVMKMGFLVESALKNGMKAFIESDEVLAHKVESGDDEIDAVEEEIDLECLRSIAMRQPVREDLRFVFAVLKTITDLERIGDQSVNIARWAVELKKYPPTPVNPTLVNMRDVAWGMLRDVLEVFKTSNGDMSTEICQRAGQTHRETA